MRYGCLTNGSVEYTNQRFEDPNRSQKDNGSWTKARSKVSVKPRAHKNRVYVLSIHCHRCQEYDHITKDCEAKLVTDYRTQEDP